MPNDKINEIAVEADDEIIKLLDDINSQECKCGTIEIDCPRCDKWVKNILNLYNKLSHTSEAKNE